MKIGETAQVALSRATNLFDTADDRARATFNVTPELAGAYFNKIECFCFTDTTLKPGETLDMPVVFFVDPDIVDVPELKDITTITFPTPSSRSTRTSRLPPRRRPRQDRLNAIPTTNLGG